MGSRIREDTVAGGNLRFWGDGSVGRARGDGSPHSRGHGSRGEFAVLGRWQCRWGKGDGFPHSRGHGSRGNLRLRGDGSVGGARGWVPAFARTREPGGICGYGEMAVSVGQGEMGSRIREDTGAGGNLRLRGDGSVGGARGMGPRIREDTGAGGICGYGKMAVSVGQGGWVPAFARTREPGGICGYGEMAVSVGQEEMGPRIREDTGGVWRLFTPIKDERICRRGTGLYP